MILCSSCQHELPENSRFCGYCGAKVTEPESSDNASSSSPSETIAGISLTDKDQDLLKQNFGSYQPEEDKNASQIDHSALNSLLDDDDDEEEDDEDEDDFSPSDTIKSLTPIEKTETSESGSGAPMGNSLDALSSLLDSDDEDNEDDEDEADDDDEIKALEQKLANLKKAKKEKAEEKARKEAEEKARKEAEEKAR